MLTDLDKILRFKSLLSTSDDKNEPFGKENAETLKFFLSLADKYGLKTANIDGYCGYAEYGNGEEMLGILCHLDVVSAGDGVWSYPPYALTIDCGYMYGRGVVDNKGPAIIMLHVLKTLKEKNVKLNRRVRLIVGCNEEDGSACIKHYRKTQEIPTFSIVPDADFPVINSEKGIFHGTINLPAFDMVADGCSFISCGERANVVPDKAIMRIVKNSPLDEIVSKYISQSGTISAEMNVHMLTQGFSKSDFTFRNFENEIEIEVRGEAGHAMAPDKADNAMWKLFMLLAFFESKYGSSSEINDFYELMCSPLSREKLGINKSDEVSGEVTFTLDILNYDVASKTLKFTFDSRLPICFSKDDMISALQKRLPNAEIGVKHFAPNLYFEPSSPLVQQLLKIYNDATGENAQPIQMGGGTYARELPSAVAFGPTFPNIQTNIHNVDECISVQNFDKLFDLYYNAVLSLDKIDKI